jgi:anthranilate phosphoribosyltransferase
MVVASEDGLDEISVCAPTMVAHLWEDGTVEVQTLQLSELGIMVHDPYALKGGDPDENAVVALDVFKGTEGAVRDAVIVNAAGALVLSGKASNMSEGIALAGKAIDSGNAMTVLEKVKAITSEETP